ncbi:hypothetical protein PFICI_03652 [Pestalotiopsis fici W106-1]|uniref:Histone-lysine N-methyltransferase SET9 n=1 Tax=Pestalotiopsis fici (strain W106-1 / CGMCC3.15140) TaxID=1229662 RepID=W3XJJ3_PESFW|nr:uncharacterized protein PFICI_03652 [Pestalotiopsis fici W106-1]ETS85627.1 hypothetical protein PFICI_03652 [Pestalotiopsis fici W106-1]
MPPSTAAQAKKQPLTLEQISKYDDILTDCLVDQTFYSSTIPKNRTTYHPSRGLREEEITKIIQNHLVVEPNLDLATEKLLALDGLRKFHNALKTDKEKDDFRKHLRRYAQIYLPDCPFEVNTTNRYTIVTYEAAVTARRFIKRGESIKYLSGIQVLITPKEEDEMTKRKKDFSIVVSSRSKCASLFMGPARFANHDCDANARLVITSQSTIEIFATKNIDLGDEITVTYGDNYFGEDNCECLCHTCEKNLANGWAQPDGESLSASQLTRSIEDDEGYRLRRRRRDDSAARSSREPSRTPDVRRRVSRSKTKLMRTESSQGSMAGSPAPEARLRQMKKREFDMLSSPPATPGKRHKSAHFDDTPVRAREDISRKSAEGETSGADSIGSTLEFETADSPGTEVTIPDEETKVPELSLQSPRPTPKKSAYSEVKTEESDMAISESGSSVRRVARQRKHSNPVRSVEDVPATGIPAASVPGVDEDVDIIPPDDLDLVVIAPPLTPASKLRNEPTLPAPRYVESEVEQSELPVKRRPGRPKASKSKMIGNHSATDNADDVAAAASLEPLAGTDAGAPSAESSLSDDDEEATPKNVRKPGDYTLTPLLLPVADSAWNWCRVCNDAFVQHEAYFTRAYCPRCERHSKLYGYKWPKTQKDGKNDKEERVLDHREIHRFLDPEEEARVRGRKYLGTFPRETKPEVVKKAPTKVAPVKKRRSSAAKNRDDDYRCSEECDDDLSEGVAKSTRVRRVSMRS